MSMAEPDDLLRMFQSITTKDHDDLIQQFSKILQCDESTSNFYLESSNWNVETAVNMYLSTAPTTTSTFIDPMDGYTDTRALPDARFLSDLSAAQSAQFLPHQPVHLHLIFQNSGTTTWPTSTSLVLSQGFHFNAPTQVHVDPVEAGATVDINLHLTMPAESGTHYGNWRLMWEGGYFGDPVWVVLTVVDEKPKDAMAGMDEEAMEIVDGDMYDQAQDMEL
ncbi:unnamed protein product [Aphanomyces euteiches]|uniref:Nbr1 FW domain-containing protein n=1 Tax=Aphanomyces euteiches TaxID=100861 RepID=A0A6G0WK25_9STRA|nr:hypothetical protein Ae201684_014444 [Aphanomyces euteiches]KAH9088851.1 hypothetical protein Ae201684P_013065 [Aphanomyces euteiches]